MLDASAVSGGGGEAASDNFSAESLLASPSPPGTASSAEFSVESVTPVLLGVDRFTFTGFFAPVDNPQAVNLAKAGQAIPVRWRLTLSGVPVSDEASFARFSSYRMDCLMLSGSLTSALEESAAGASGLQYLRDGNWQFNWKTLKSYAGTCRGMVVTLSDGASYFAYVRFK